MSDELVKDEPAEKVVDEQKEVSIDEQLSKMKAEFEAETLKREEAWKAKVSKLDKVISEKDREKMSEAEKQKAELEDLRLEKETASKELNDLRKKRIIDSALYGAELPAELFEGRISGETKEEIEADVASMKSFLKDLIDKEVEKQTKALLKGDTPPKQDDNNLTERDKLIAQYDEAEKKGDAVAMLGLKDRIRKLPKN